MRGGELFRRIRFLLRGRSDGGLNEEMRLHLELRAKRFRDAGMDEETARQRARRQFGNSTQFAETSRGAWTFGWVDSFARDLRYAVRALRRKPVFSLVAILSLGIALGANTAVFSFVRAIVMKQLPAPGAERFVILRQHNEQFQMENCCFQFRFFEELRKHDVGFEDALALDPVEVNFTDREQTEKLQAEIVSGNYFRMLGVRAAAGRLLDDSDDSARVCVISYRLWHERFGGDATVVGRRVLVNSEPVQIVGVTEAGFSGASLHHSYDLQIPSSMSAKLIGGGRDEMRWVQIIARLKPGVTAAQVLPRLNVTGLELERSAGLNFTERDTFSLADGSQGLDSSRQQLGRPVLLLFGLVGLVLLVACTNLAALLIVRNAERASEAGVRLALGGSQPALMRHHLAESLVIAAAGALFAIALAPLMIDLPLSLLGAQGVGLARHVQPDTVIFGFATLAALVAVALFGILPAWRAAQCDPLPAIRGVDSAGPGSRSILSRTLMAGQIALSLALLFAAGLFVRTLSNLRSIDVGFKPENVALLHLDVSGTSYAETGAPTYFAQVLERARALPGTRAASLSTLSVLSGSMQSVVLRVPGYVPPNRLPPVTFFTAISSGYFRTLGIPLRAGRDFTGDDRAPGNSEGVAIVNDQFARKYLGGDAVGKVFVYGGGRRVRVVGMAGTAHFRRLREDPQPVMYLPVTQGAYPKALHLQVRTEGEPSIAIQRLRALLREVDARVPVDRVTTMDMQIDEALARERLLAFLSGLMGSIAVVLAAIGLYGVMSFSVARRTREIGIRLAIGAERSRILRQFLRESAIIVATGIAAGIPLALGAGALAASLLYGLPPRDILTIAGSTAILLLVALIAAIIPAGRAARLDPIRALRWE